MSHICNKKQHHSDEPVLTVNKRVETNHCVTLSNARQGQTQVEEQDGFDLLTVSKCSANLNSSMFNHTVTLERKMRKVGENGDN